MKHYETTKEDSILETNRKFGAILFGAAVFYEKTDPILSEILLSRKSYNKQYSALYAIGISKKNKRY